MVSLRDIDRQKTGCKQREDYFYEKTNVVLTKLAVCFPVMAVSTGALVPAFSGRLGLYDVAETVEAGTVYYPRCGSGYKSIVDALNSIGVNYGYSNRKAIAEVNGISRYTGTASQNTTLLSKLKSGKLVKSVSSVGGASTAAANGQKQNLSAALYNSSKAYISCDFDGYHNTKGRHEGIDIRLSNGANVYSLTDGVVVRVAAGKNGSSGLSTIAIYNR